MGELHAMWFTEISQYAAIFKLLQKKSRIQVRRETLLEAVSHHKAQKSDLNMKPNLNMVIRNVDF